MAFPNINNIINGYFRPEMPTQEEQSLLHVNEKQQTNKIKEVDDPGGTGDNQRPRLARSISDTDLPHTTTSPTRRRSKSSCCFGCLIAAIDDGGNPYEKQDPKPSNSSALPGDTAPARTLVLTTNLHCEGCTSKIIGKIKKIEGVQEVRVYRVKDMIEVDTALSSDWLTEYLSGKLRRKVELVLVRLSDQAIGLKGRENKENTKKSVLNESVGSEVHSSPIKLPKGDTVINTTPNSPEPKLNRNDQIPNIAELPQSGYTNKTRDKNNNTKYTSQRPNAAAVQPISDSLEAIATNVAVLKVRLHCHGCVEKIRRTVFKIRGVERVKFNIEKELMEVQGTMDIKQQLPRLTKKLKRNVEIIQVRPCSTPENRQEDNKEEDAEEAKTKEPVADEVGNKQESGLSIINDQKSSDDSEESYRKKLVEMVQKEEGVKGGVAVEEVNKGCAIGCPPIYNLPYECRYEFSGVATRRLEYFSEDNPNACSIM